jgi:hypothetical protein
VSGPGQRLFTKSRLAGEGAAGAGRLSLLVSGFGRQSVVQIDEVLRAIDRLPSFHLEGLREIAYLPEFGPFACAYASLAAGGEPLGEFQQYERRVYIYGFEDRPRFEQVLFHELGHFVFFLVIGSRVKKRWVTGLSARSAYITDYAALNAREDFAESYASYLIRPRLLEEACPAKFAFMRDCVFSGAPENRKEIVRG